ncbi:hypothetical protein BCT73_06560 [Vibrio breoganii]|uniref:glycosyltransferase family 2 protein n=1 Tax=Vibrio breoganii TaxID=553239 RepID=UPI000C81BFA1|nr:glycosyltransferase [Vibrio breoganii]PML61247.1 hypothetical protein BCT73_06560 [Vibrio breoganii]
MKISILLCTYNDELFIKDCIDSILHQSHSNFEFIIINDGSTDSTLDIINSYKDERIKVFTKVNSGLTSSLNFGLKQCETNWIARVDADDICFSNRLEEQIKHIDEDVAVIGSRAKIIDGEGNYLRNDSSLPLNHEEILAAMCEAKQSMLHPSVLINKKLIDLVGGYDPRFIVAQDIDLWLRLAQVGKLKNVDMELIKLRKHLGNISLSKLHEQTVNGILSRVIYRKTIGNRNRQHDKLLDDKSFYMFKGYIHAQVDFCQLYKIRLHSNTLASFKEKNDYIGLVKFLLKHPSALLFPFQKKIWKKILSNTEKKRLTR